ncbi:MAG: Zn-dependent hydrolase [Waddliaceae bacterium]|nr:Zn-dependent hydrolase [Waddliaceae bacterium]
MNTGFTILASGSKGNSILLVSEEAKVIIDAGLSTKALEARLESIGVSMQEIDAILLTHEHHDHMSALPVLTKRYQIPICANAETAKAIMEKFKTPPQFKIFSTGETFSFKDLEIHPFSVQHDCMDPVMFTIKTGQVKLGFCTDLGFVTTLVRHQLKNCDYLHIEANHRPSMVHACPRPMSYKQRVLGRSGHLSNEACGELLREIAHPDLKKVFLAHLSQECNHPDVALSTVREILEKEGIELELDIAHQDKVSTSVEFSPSSSNDCLIHASSALDEGEIIENKR